MVIYSIEDKQENEELLHLIQSQNEILADADVKIEFRMKSNYGTNLVISLNPEPFKKLIKIGIINIGWQRLRLREYIRPMQCFKCQMNDQLAKFCRNEQKCSNWGSKDHAYKDFKEDAECINCVIYNERYNAGYEVKHNSRDKCCLVRDKEVNNLKFRIDYGS